MKRLLIIGGTSGLGKQVRDLITGYNITSIGSKTLDVTNMLACEKYFSSNEFDIVVNFAGVNYDSMVHKVTNTSQSEIEHLIDVNIKGTINVISACLKSMRKNNYGRIILISSVLSDKVVFGTGLYASCKAFIDRLIKNVSVENIKYGVTANTLQLGYFDGGMTYKIQDEQLRVIKETIGLRRFGKIQEIVNTINYLVNTEYTTGINIKIDGGL